MAIILMAIAGILTALSNLCMRTCMDYRGSSRAFFVFQLLFTFVVVTFLYPVRSESHSFNPWMVAVAVLGGAALGMMKLAIGKALQEGPFGLIFAVVNCACVMPSIIVVMFLSDFIQCEYSMWNALGSFLVMVGLVWAGVTYSDKKEAKRIWIFFAAAGFILHTFYLLATEWRLYLKAVGCVDTQWFVPIIFLAATSMHALIFVVKERREPYIEEIGFGMLGGIFNGVCTYIFVLATEIATAYEQPIIFPAFSVALIVACNLWGQWLYRERVNWYANGICLAGLAVGAIY